MPKLLQMEEVRTRVQAFLDAGRDKARAARALGIGRSALTASLEMAVRQGLLDNTDSNPDVAKFASKAHRQQKEPEPTPAPAPAFVAPEFASPDVPFEQDIPRLVEAFRRRHQAHQSRAWAPYRLTIDGPFATTAFGDPHLDDDGCNWPVLVRDIETVQATEGMFGIGMGDYLNNWSRRLAHLYAEQEMTRSRSFQAASWFFRLPIWMLLVKGNHDLWSGSGDPLDWMARGSAVLEKWQARVRLISPNGREFRIWAAHDFPGSSQWNNLHSNMKAAKFSGAADVYLSGDKHNYGIIKTEDEHRNRVYIAARARGYKFIDGYGENLGFMPQQNGASVTVVFDPTQEGPRAINAFDDTQEAAEFLSWKRARFQRGLASS